MKMPLAISIAALHSRSPTTAKEWKGLWRRKKWVVTAVFCGCEWAKAEEARAEVEAEAEAEGVLGVSLVECARSTRACA